MWVSRANHEVAPWRGDAAPRDRGAKHHFIARERDRGKDRDEGATHDVATVGRSREPANTVGDNFCSGARIKKEAAQETLRRVRGAGFLLRATAQDVSA